MKQRVAVAMATILNPKLIIADEPTTALDVILQAQIVNLFKTLKKRGVSILFIENITFEIKDGEHMILQYSLKLPTRLV